MNFSEVLEQPLTFLWDLTAIAVGTVGIVVLVVLLVFIVVGIPSLVWEALLDRLER